MLLRPDQDYVVSHPLVHAFAQQHLASPSSAPSASVAQTITLWRERLVTTLLTHVRQSDRYDAGSFARWFPHVLPWLKADDLLPEQRLQAASLFLFAGNSAYYQGKYEQAQPLLQQALAIREQRLGAEHPDTATSLNNLAELYRSQGKDEQAEPLYQRALAICEQRLGSEHPSTRAVRENYVGLLQRMERWQG